MTYNTQGTSTWESLKRLPQRMSLRTKLIAAALSLVAIALLVISVAGLSFLRSYLIGAADDQLYAAIQHGHFGAQVYSPEGFASEFLVKGKPAFQNIQVPPGQSGPQISADAQWLASGKPATVAASSGQGTWRVLAVPNQTLTFPNGDQVGPGTYVVGVDVTSQYATIGKLTNVDVVVSLIILLALGAVGTAVVRASLRPLKEIEETAGAIAAGDLTRRVPERDPQTEVGSLGRSLNVMLSQIETAFDAQSDSEEAARRSEGRMRQFVADASHELRTPLTAIRGFAEYYRQRGGVAPPAEEITAPNGSGKLEPADLDRIMRRVEQEAARMGVLVEDMLMLARLDQQRPLDRNTVDLLTLAADAVHDARVVAPDRKINLSVGSGAALLIEGDEVRLRQVIGNLMSNALSHTPAGTPVNVHLRSGSMAEIQAATATPAPVIADRDGLAGSAGSAQSAAVLEVTDQGPGLSAEQASHAFERFYRADAARTTGGNGLGLAIVAALVAAHGGAVWVKTQPGQGATFAIALPLAPEAVPEPGQEDEPDEADRIEHTADGDWIDSHSGGNTGGSPA